MQTINVERNEVCCIVGFLDGFMKGIADDRRNRETIREYHDLMEDDTYYRKKAFENTDSNYGWYTCPRCGKKYHKDEMDVDHIVPQSKGGDHSRYNLQVMCQHCNRSKQDKMDDTYKDLERRRRELNRQDQEDLKFLNSISKRR